MATATRLGYIDGLRAIAILGVVAFHCGIPFIAGGFLGVDVFFVLSGFLIIGMILRGVDRGDFSFVEFYCGRALRIGPPLAIVVMATLAAAWLLGLSPFEQRWYGKTAALTLALVPNIFFAHNVGYFEPKADFQPFLHMWSLGVEEQFYIAAPLILVVAGGISTRRRAAWLFCILALAFVASLTLFLTAQFQVAFYLTQCRVWEFAAGGIVALASGSDIRLPPVGAAVALYAGLVLIAVSILGFPSAHFPGPIGILPVIATAAVLTAGEAGYDLAGLRYIGHPILARIGLISYSWYLWHWALLVLLRALLVGHRSIWLDIFVSGLCGGLLAAATSYWIERPCRALRHSPYFRRNAFGILASSGVVAAVLIVISAGYEVETNNLKRASIFAPIRAAAADPIDTLCHQTAISSGNKSVPVCQLGSGSKTIVIWGDSLVGSLVFGANELAQSSKAKVLLIWKAGCVPLLGVDIAWRGEPRKDCRDHNEAVIALLKRGAFGEKPPIVIASAWAEYGEWDGLTVAIPAGARDASVDYATLLPRSLKNTLETASPYSAQILVIGPLPIWPYSVPLCVSATMKRDLSLDYCMSGRAKIREQRGLIADSIRRESAKFHNVEYADPINAFCSDSKCSPLRNNEILFRDMVHLNSVGSEYLFGFLKDDVDTLLR